MATRRRQNSSGELFDVPPLADEIPYESTVLLGYLFALSGCTDDAPRPLLVVTNGSDGTAEGLFLANDVAGLEHGFQVLVFDGPGQGSVISEQGLPFRPDWENVVTPVIDYALTLPGVDAGRLVLLGWSFGG